MAALQAELSHIKEDIVRLTSKVKRLVHSTLPVTHVGKEKIQGTTDACENVVNLNS